ncbi:hypothetical protein Pcatena_15460 [Parolsenella catena]|uniref:Uncharacterized protein n=1 Tax=Parolsenella catena TaxID=2003188 RepID=A0A3G9K8Y7_9ACTN|nr:hypothetical protein Pcatena_15460 [Parolsenella catena]
MQDVQALAGNDGLASAVDDVERGGGGQHEQGRGVCPARDHEHDGAPRLRPRAAAGSLEGLTVRISAADAWQARSPHPLGPAMSARAILLGCLVYDRLGALAHVPAIRCEDQPRTA